MSATLILRTVENRPLTNLEVDNNFSNLNIFTNTVDSNVGVLSNLVTSAQSNLVFAINEVDTESVKKAGNVRQLAVGTSADVAAIVSDETGTGALVFANAPTLLTPNIGAATGQSISLTGGGTFGGNVTISGSLSVLGNVTTFTSNDLIISDPLIFIGDNNNGNAVDLGLIVTFNNGTFQHGGFVRDASDGKWKLFSNVINEPNTTNVVDFTNAVYDTIKIGNVEAAFYTAGDWRANTISTTYTEAKVATVAGVSSLTISNTTLLEGIKAVDGAGSGLDADLLDGNSSAFYTNADNISAGTLNSARLPASGVSASSYGGASQIPAIVIDTYGRITSAANVATTSITSVGTLTTGTWQASPIANNYVVAKVDDIIGDSGEIEIGKSGNLYSIGLSTSGVTNGVYGNSSVIPVITVDSFGRITSVSNVGVAATISIANSSIAGNIIASQIQPTGVTPGVYGAAALQTVITVDHQGRITSASNVTSTVANSNITGNIISTQLQPTGVTAGVYGNASVIPVLTIDNQGRITSAANAIVSSTVANTQITGNIIASQLQPTGVTPSTYGAAAVQAVFTVDHQGRITSASNVTSTVANSNITGNIISTQLQPTGVTASTYGAAAVQAVLTIDAQGRITSASNVTSTVANTNITGNIISSQITSVANSQITGNIIASQIQPTGVTASTYGAAAVQAVITVDAQGRITSASNVTSTVANSNITGNIISTQLQPTGVTAGVYGNASVIPVLTIDNQGRITSAANAIVSSTVANSAITGNIIASQLQPTGVTPSTYGGAAVQTIITVDHQGRITSASNVTSTVANSNITGNIISSQIQPTGVTTGVYGNATIIPVITVDAQGRLTSVANVASAGGVTSVGGVQGAISNAQILAFVNSSTGSLNGNLGVSAGSANISFIEYNGLTATAGQFDGGTTNPSDTTRLNYNGYFYATRFYGDGSNLTNLPPATDEFARTLAVLAL